MPTPYWDQRLQAIREKLIEMSGLVEANLGAAFQALMQRDEKRAAEVEEADDTIDRLEMVIDEMVVAFVSTHGVAASDTRFVFTASKISGNLERIADEATTIARRCPLLNGTAPLEPQPELAQLAAVTQGMLRAAIEAFLKQEPDRAVETIGQDKLADGLYKELVCQLTAAMTEDPQRVECALNYMRAAKALERAADHATNIAEEVVYLYRGKDIRHSGASSV